MKRTPARSAVVAATAMLVLYGALRQPHAAPATPAEASAAADQRRRDLVCTAPSNCVNSLDSGGLPALRFEGTPAQAIAALRATLAKFPEAKILTDDGLSMEVAFTTAQGFRDRVDFSIDAQARRIDFRSRSSFGRSDFGKNRVRMEAFSVEFEQALKR